MQFLAAIGALVVATLLLAGAIKIASELTFKPDKKGKK